MINILRQIKKFIVELMNRLFYDMVHQLLQYCWLTNKQVFCFLPIDSD